MSKHFINDRSSIVTEALDAAVMLGNGKIARLDGYPSIKVVVRADWHREGRVALISGGGSGHEPAHAGFVGDGMLTAAVCGEIFASPSVDAVLAAILAVTGSAGCLLIVKSYTGDRLNFGLAAEKARALGFAVEMVIVGDDIAIPGAPHPRGIAGTLFVHKVAGHVARSGAKLAEVKATAEAVARTTTSMGVAVSTCTIPGRDAASEQEPRIGARDVELGLGIHGEPGVSIMTLPSIDELATAMVREVDKALNAAASLSGNRSAPLALLINDLGGVPPIELSVASLALVNAMKAAGRNVKLVVGPNRLMTSLDMKGISISALPLSDEIEEALSSAVEPHAWPGVSRLAAEAQTPITLAAQLKTKDAPASSNAARRTLVERACNTLVALQSELDALDAKVGDGDTGTTFATGAKAVLSALEELPLDNASALCVAISNRLSRAMGGSSGILLAIFFAAMGVALDKENATLAKALREGADRVQLYGGAKEGDRTMLDALLPAITALEANKPFTEAAHAANKGAAGTAAMTKAKAGRSSYIRESALEGVKDPGAVAIAALLESAS